MRFALGAARAVISASIVILFVPGALLIMGAQALIGAQKFLTEKLEALPKGGAGGFWK